VQSSPDTASIRTNIIEFAELSFKLPYCVNIKLYFEFYIIFLFCTCAFDNSSFEKSHSPVCVDKQRHLYFICIGMIGSY
jgi:hypothetical protein